MKLVVLAVALVAGGCRIAPVRLGSDSAHGQTLGKRTEFAEKIVNMKRAPVTLIARDGSQCTVDEVTWRDTRVGESATCMWNYTDTR
jgi:hypothetical protein